MIIVPLPLFYIRYCFGSSSISLTDKESKIILISLSSFLTVFVLILFYFGYSVHKGYTPFHTKEYVLENKSDLETLKKNNVEKIVFDYGSATVFINGKEKKIDFIREGYFLNHFYKATLTDDELVLHDTRFLKDMTNKDITTETTQYIHYICNNISKIK